MTTQLTLDLFLAVGVPRPYNTWNNCSGRVSRDSSVRIGTGLEIVGCQEPRVPLISSAAPSNFWRVSSKMYCFLYRTPLGSS